MLILEGTLLLAAPLIAAALGGLYSERSGVVNIGLEGMMTFGAFIGATVIYLSAGSLGNFAIPLGVFCAILGGMLFSTLHAYLSITLKIDQIISGVVINILTLALSLYFCKILFAVNETPRFMISAAKLTGTKITYITFLVFALCFVTYFIINKTKWGLRVRAVGENPQAADAMGINVTKVRYQAVIISGAFAGLAGVVLCLNSIPQFTVNTVAGTGFIALAVLIFGRHNAFGVLIAGLIFGFFKQIGIISLGSSFEVAIPFTDFIIPEVFYNILPYLITIIVLIIFSRGKNQEMEALGKPYDKELR